MGLTIVYETFPILGLNMRIIPQNIVNYVEHCFGYE